MLLACQIVPTLHQLPPLHWLTVSTCLQSRLSQTMLESPQTMAGGEVNIPKELAAAEEFLHLGASAQARDAAANVLHAAATPSEVSRALFVLLQADYQEQRCAAAKCRHGRPCAAGWLPGKLHEVACASRRVQSLEQTSMEFNRTLENLPVSAVLLWCASLRMDRRGRRGACMPLRNAIVPCAACIWRAVACEREHSTAESSCAGA
jgi:hypothetical protein